MSSRSPHHRLRGSEPIASRSRSLQHDHARRPRRRASPVEATAHRRAARRNRSCAARSTRGARARRAPRLWPAPWAAGEDGAAEAGACPRAICWPTGHRRRDRLAALASGRSRRRRRPAVASCRPAASTPSSRSSCFSPPQAAVLTAWRLVRCNPTGGQGVDEPVAAARVQRRQRRRAHRARRRRVAREVAGSAAAPASALDQAIAIAVIGATAYAAWSLPLFSEIQFFLRAWWAAVTPLREASSSCRRLESGRCAQKRIGHLQLEVQLDDLYE